MVNSRRIIIVVVFLLASMIGFSVVAAGAGGLVEPVGPQPEMPCVPDARQPRLLDDPEMQVAFEAVLAHLNATWLADATALEGCYALYIVPDEQPMWS